MLPRGSSVAPSMPSSSTRGDQFETPHAGVSSMTREAGVLRVSIPALYPWSALLFLFFWLVIWSVAGLATLVSLLVKALNGDGAGSTLFLAAWCVLWLFGEIFAVRMLFWGLFGREDIIVGLTGLEHRKTCLGISRSKLYEISSISRFRTAPAVSHKLRSEGDDDPPPDSSSISFDYGAKSVIMASGMDDAEATRIVEEIRRFNRRLRPREDDRSLP